MRYTRIVVSILLASFCSFWCNLSYTKKEKLKPTDIFSSLDQIKTYAAANEQYPDIDNKDWLNPDYTSFYKKNVPTGWQNVLSLLRIKKPIWTASHFKTLLKNVTNYKENNGETGRFVKRIHPDPRSKFIIWGNLFGAFHSLARCLEYLHKKNIIDKNLKIVGKNTYFVFLGNVIDLSPYILETLTVVLKLIEANPDNVIYLRGSHEEKEKWLKFGLKTELQIKTKAVSNEIIPLKKLIDRFFQTLPLSLYITAESDKKLHAVRISYPGRDYREIDEIRFTPLFKNNFDNSSNKKIKIFDLKNATTAKKTNVAIKAIIKAPYKKPIPPTGLSVTSPDKGSTAFLLFSSPTKTFRAINQFFYDAFAIIDIKEKFEDWTISLYNQDIREKLGIHKSKTYNLSTGYVVSKDLEKLTKKVKNLEKKLKTCKLSLEKAKAKPTPAPTPTKVVAKKEPTPKVPTPKKPTPKVPTPKKPTPKVPTPKKPTPKVAQKIVLGSTLDTTGPLTQIGKSIRKGIFEATAGKEGVTQVTLDDNNNPKRITKNIEELTKKHKVNSIISPIALSEHKTLIKLAKNKKNLFLFPIPSFTTNEPNIINFGPTYEQIAKFSLKYAAEVERAKKLAFFYSQELLNGTMSKIVKNLEPDTYVKVSYNTKTIEFEETASKIRDFRPQLLFIWATPAVAKNIITQIKPMNLAETIIMGHNLCCKSFKTFLQENKLEKQYIGIESIPNPCKSNLPIMQECRKKLKKEVLDVFSAQSYIATTIAIDAIKKIKGPLDPSKIIKEIEAVKNYNFKGLQLNFDKKTRTLSQHLWIDKGKDKWERTTIAAPPVEKQLDAEKKSLSVRKNEIVIGTTMDLKGAVRGVSQRTLKAIKAVFYLTTKAGGIRNKTIKIIAENDNYKPRLAAENIRKFFTESNIDIIISPVGGPTTESYIDYIKKGDILVLFPSTGAPTLRDPKLRYMIHFRPSYNDIYAAAVKYLKENEATKKIAFVYQDDAASGNAVKMAIEKNKLEKYNFLKVPFGRGQRNFKELAKKIEDFDPDAIAFWCQTLVMINVIKEIGAPNLKNKLLLTTEMGSSAVLKHMEKIGLDQNFINTENIPSSATSNLEIMKEYRKYLKVPDPFLAETWVSTNFFVDILKKIPDPITKEKIINAMENTKNYKFKGFDLNFNPKNRTLSNNIWIYRAGKEVAKVSTQV